MPHSYRPSVCAHCHNSFMARTDALLHGEGRFCSRPCAAKNRPKTDPAARFWAKVDKSSTCWNWTADVNTRGYGFFALRHGVKIYAHRYSYQLAAGPIPKGLFICHRCDNPRCVRPDHLFAGTQKQNIQDAVSKGRMARGDRQGSRKVFLSRAPAELREPTNAYARGAKHGMSKLTEPKIRTIRLLSSTMTQGAIAHQFGVTAGAVSLILSRKRWAHV